MSERIIRRTAEDDLPEVFAIYERARAFMRANGNPTQWGSSRPAEETVRRDVAEGRSYLVCEDGRILGVFACLPGPDPTYALIEEGEWQNDLPYAVIHRIAAAEEGRGILGSALRFAESLAPSVRIDTHPDNAPMRHLLEREGFCRCGIIYTDDGTVRLAYQK